MAFRRGAVFECWRFVWLIQSGRLCGRVRVDAKWQRVAQAGDEVAWSIGPE
jgi:hypothetical protein